MSRHDQAASLQILRGRRIELVDAAGMVRAVLEPDPRSQPRLRMISTAGIPVLDIGLRGATGIPYLQFNARDGDSRLQVGTSQDRPYILMGDQSSPSKVVLGFVESDAPDPKMDTWALEFNEAPPHHRPIAGMYAELGAAGKPTSGSVVVRNTQGRTSYFHADNRN